MSEHATTDGAFDQLERLSEKFRSFGLPGNVIEMLVVDSTRRPVMRES